jgi:hypothetical protein
LDHQILFFILLGLASFLRVLFLLRTQLAIQCCGRKVKGMLIVSNKADLDCLSLNKNVSPGFVRIESKYFAGLHLLGNGHSRHSCSVNPATISLSNIFGTYPCVKVLNYREMARRRHMSVQRQRTAGASLASDDSHVVLFQNASGLPSSTRPRHMAFTMYPYPSSWEFPCTL